MIQLYAKTADLKQTEDFDSEPVRAMLAKWSDSFEKEGIVWCLRVRKKGEVDDGNARLLHALQNGIEFLPIDIKWFLGFRGEKVLVK